MLALPRPATAILTVLASASFADPIVLRANVRAIDAPELELKDHGITGHNVKFVWQMEGPGKDGPAVYAFCDPASHRGKPEERFLAWDKDATGKKVKTKRNADGTPVFVRFDLVSGKAHEFFLSDEVFLANPTERAGLIDITDKPEDDDVDFGESTAVQPASKPLKIRGWPWARPASGWNGRSNTFLIATATGEVIRHSPDDNMSRFEGTIGTLVSAAGMDNQDSVWVGCGQGTLHRFQNGTSRKFTQVFTEGEWPHAITADNAGNVYVLTRGTHFKLYRLEYEPVISPNAIEAVQVRVEFPLNGASFKSIGGGVYVAPAVSYRPAALRLNGGRAVPISGLPTPAAEYAWKTDFDAQPPSVLARKTPNTEWTAIPVHFSRASVDGIKTVKVSADGKTLFGANYPVAWIWRMNLADETIRRENTDYVWYEMQNAGNEVYAIGYYGIKLLRWDPSKPWTMDVSSNPSREAWGRRDCNPYFISNLRFQWNLNLRRPSGLSIDRTGRIYTGGHNPSFTAVGEGVRTQGALFWYDPNIDAIGAHQLTNDVVHDVCAVGDYVAVGVTRTSFRYETPVTERVGGFHLFDTRQQEMVKFESPLKGGSVVFLEEATPGILVGGGRMGDYKEPGFGSALFIYDVSKMQTTHVIKMVGHFGYSPYVSKARFIRGPDNKIYFYTQKPQGYGGAVLFRLDPRTGQVKAIAKGPGISDRGAFMAGPSFSFGPHRVYFASGSRLVSARIEDFVEK